MKIGIFGGTFDPPHIGHVIAAQDACTALALDRFIFMPAAQPPHKQGSGVSDASVRLEMLAAAVAGNPLFEISTIELNRSGPSYTVDTLRQLSAQFREDVLFLLIGVDQVREFATWREPQEVLQLAQLVMLSRSGTDEPGEQNKFVKHTVAVTRIDVSSTLIRRRVAEGQPIRYLVADAVAEIVAREGLYR